MDQVKQENLISEGDATYKSTTLMPEARSPIGLNHNPYSAHRQQQPLQATYSAYDNSQLVGSTLSCNRDEFTGPQSIDQLAPTDPAVAYSIPHHRSDISHNYRFESIYSHPMEYASLNNNNCFNEQLQAAHVTIGGSNNNNFYVEEQYSTADYQYHPQTYSQQHRKANSWQPQDCQYAYNYYDTYQTNELHNQNEPVSDRSGYYSSSDHLACSQQESQQEHDTMHPSLAVGDQNNDAHKDQSQRLDSEDIETSYYKLSSQQSIKTDLPIEHQGEYTPDLCKLHEIRPPSGHQHAQTPPEARLARTIQQRQQQIKFKSMVGKQSGTKSHSSSNPVVQRTNQCGVCGRNYARPSTLKTHLRTHTNERPFKCNVCYKTFSQAANLTAHQRVHTGERPFSCPICGRQFSQSSSVITHLRTHSGERPYRCAMCSRTFSDSSTLTKHRRIHSGEKPYQCDYCPLNFSQSGNLSRHLKLHLMGTSSTSSTVSSTSSNSSSSSLSS